MASGATHSPCLDMSPASPCSFAADLIACCACIPAWLPLCILLLVGCSFVFALLGALVFSLYIVYDTESLIKSEQ